MSKHVIYFCIRIKGKGYGVYRHFQQYFSYIVEVRFIGGEKHEYPENTTDLPH
jgi:hypothetical protein